MDLHLNSVGSHSRLFESLSSMLSRSALNPADISIVSHTPLLLCISILDGTGPSAYENLCVLLWKPLSVM